MRNWVRLLIVLTTFAPSRSEGSDPTPIAVSIPDRKEPVSYSKEIVEILSAKCIACHNEVLAENRLNMEEVAGMIQGGKNGPSLVVGKADQSLLFQMAAHRVEPVMPPKGKKDLQPLTSDELGLLKLWIDSGAKDDSDDSPERNAIELGTLPPGLHAVNAVDLTADGGRIAAGRANLVQVDDADSGLEIISLGGHKDYVQSIKFSPNGRLVAAGGYQTVILWNAPTGYLRSKFEGHAEPLKAVVRLGDGDRFATTSFDKTVRIWETGTGKLLKTFNAAGQACSLAASSDSKTLAVGLADGSIQVLRVEDGKELLKLTGHQGSVNQLAFLADNRRIVSASADQTARIWSLPASDGSKAAEPVVLGRHRGAVNGVVVVSGGETIATSGDDGTVRFWKVENGKLLRTVTLQGGAIRSLAVDPQGRRILAGSADGFARMFELETGRLLSLFKGTGGPIEAIAFNASGDRLAASVGLGGIKIWETENGQGVMAFGHSPINAAGPSTPTVACLTFLKNDLIVSGSMDRTLKTWQFEGVWTENRRLGPHAYRVLALDFNPDGTLLAAGGGEPSRSGEIQLWEVGKGMHVRTLDSLHSDTVFSLKFSPDGLKLASAGADRFLKVTSVETGKEVRSYEGHTSHVMAVDWKADGKQLVSGGADNVLKVWDVESGEQVRTLVPAGKQVTSVRWIPGKSDILAASGDQLVRIWDADGGQIKRDFVGSSDYVFSVAASSDGKRVVAGGADGLLYFWNGETGGLLRKLDIPTLAR